VTTMVVELMTTTVRFCGGSVTAIDTHNKIIFDMSVSGCQLLITYVHCVDAKFVY